MAADLNNVELTERSRKFYQGTYTWDTEGFTDDCGVYRSYDCYDPDARAPTPLPPMSLGDSAEEQSSYQLKVFTFATTSGEVETMDMGYEELFQGRPDRAHLMSKMEGILAACQYVPRHMKTLLTLEECCHLCGVENATEVQKRALIKDMTALTQKNGIPSQITPKRASVSPHSDLSSCPSDLSDWSITNKTRAKENVATPCKTLRSTSKAEVETETARKPSTRGVAQKIARKPLRKSAASRTSEKTPAVLSLAPDTHTHVREGESWSQRRSVRQARKREVQ
ncbi:hypothetical protein ACN47E_004130 [Coniothyrium glycines]